MKHTLFLILLNFSFFQTFSQTKNFLDRPFLETEAEVDTLIMPDKIHLIILLDEESTRNRRSTEELEKSMVRILKLLPVDIEEDLSLLDYSSDFKDYFLSGQKILKTKMYSLVVNSAQTVGKVIAGLEQENISNVSIDKTEYSGSDQLLLQLKSKAIFKAKQNAQKMISALDQSLGKAIYVSDLGTASIKTQLQGKVSGIQIRGASSINNSNETIDISFEKIRFFSKVQVKFALD